MATKKTNSGKRLRSKAEKILLKRRKPSSKEPAGDIPKLIHELEVHQIELEMQNDELRSKQMEIEEARDRYLDLYDFAPVGYFTFDKTGRIAEVNLAGASLLGLPRARLIGMPFTRFVDDESIVPFHTHLKNVFSSEVSQTCELKIRQRGKKSLVYVSLRSLSKPGSKGPRCRTAAMDITERKLAEEELLKAREELVRTNERLRYLSDRLLKVQEEERKRIALEVHDGFASSLSAIKHRLQDIPSELKSQYNLEEVSNQLATAIEEAKRIQTSLRPSALDDLGIGPTLNWFCREFQKTYPFVNIEKRFQFAEAQIPDPIKVTIFRIAQEALNNIARHSKANCVSLSLCKTDNSIDLVIQDNGQGFDAEKVLSRENFLGGLGLSSMKERVGLSGGSFRIESAPGNGTIIRVSWPSTSGT